MKRIKRLAAAALILTAALLLAPARAQVSYSSELSINQLAFFAGHWSGDVFGGIGEEAWFAPNAGTMLGSFRHMKDDVTTFSEFFIIEETDDGIIFRFSHFNNDYTTWEDAKGTGPLEFKLVSVENNTAIFDANNDYSPDYMRYMLTENGQLAIKVGGINEEGFDDSFEVFLSKIN